MDVTRITACGYDVTVVYLHEVMLRTMSTFCKQDRYACSRNGLPDGNLPFYAASAVTVVRGSGYGASEAVFDA
jgi:hypothetical protein